MCSSWLANGHDNGGMASWRNIINLVSYQRSCSGSVAFNGMYQLCDEHCRSVREGYMPVRWLALPAFSVNVLVAIMLISADNVTAVCTWA